MKLHTHILLRLTILFAGMIVCILVAVILSYKNADQTNIATRDYMRNSGLEISKLRLSKSAEYISVVYQQISTDMLTFNNETINALSHSRPVKKYYETYYGDPAVDSRTPPLDYEFKQKFSTTFKLGVVTMNDLHNIAYINETSLTDNIARILFKSSAGLYSKLLVGLNDGTFRRYPYSVVSTYNTLAYICADGTNRNVIGYDPRCRPWYVQAIRRPNTIVFSSPYVDTATNKFIISSSLTINFNSSIFGVINIDFDMNILDTIVQQTVISKNGYLILTDNLGNVVSSPKLNRIDNTNPTLYVFEPSIPSNVWDQILQTTIYNTVDTIQTTKNGETWYVNYYYMSVSDQYLIMIFPETDMLIEADLLNTQVKTTITNGTIAISIVLVFEFIIIVILSLKKANDIVKPLNEITKFTQEITKVNLNVQLKTSAPKSAEIDLMYKEFENLITAIKFGNDAYYAGDSNRALENINATELLMTKSNNRAGIALCHNNKAAVMRQLKKYDVAIELYTSAVKHAENLVNEHKDNPENKTASLIIFGNRLMNLGVTYKDCGNFAMAMKYFNLSLEKHRESDYTLGIARVSGNIGQLYILQNQLDHAERELLETYELLNNKNDDISSQYTTMNLGLLYEAKRDYVKAERYFKQTLEAYEEIDSYVQQVCLNKLVNVYTILGQHEKAGNTHQLIKTNLKKNLVFALDCSGSMAGGRIKQCRVSIKNIIDNYINYNDRMSLIIFNSASKKLFSLIEKGPNGGPNYATIINALENHTEPNGNTAFYDALHIAINDVVDDDWVIALTDGEDNRSKVKPSEIINLLSHRKINLVIITIGDLTNEASIKQICQATKGHHIPISMGNDRGIANAFAQVALLISGQVVMESFN